MSFSLFDKAETNEAIIRLLEQGLGPTAIAKALNQLGPLNKDGREFDYKSVKRRLTMIQKRKVRTS